MLGLPICRFSRSAASSTGTTGTSSALRLTEPTGKLPPDGPLRPSRDQPLAESRLRDALTFLTSSSLRPAGSPTGGTERVLALPAIAGPLRISGMKRVRIFGTDRYTNNVAIGTRAGGFSIHFDLFRTDRFSFVLLALQPSHLRRKLSFGVYCLVWVARESTIQGSESGENRERLLVLSVPAKHRTHGFTTFEFVGRFRGLGASLEQRFNAIDEQDWRNPPLWPIDVAPQNRRAASARRDRRRRSRIDQRRVSAGLIVVGKAHVPRGRPWRASRLAHRSHQPQRPLRQVRRSIAGRW
jgi:hypothetical protein